MTRASSSSPTSAPARCQKMTLVPLSCAGVAEARAPSGGVAAGCSRLPPGRHGLPREFVAQNQRDRLAAGTIAAVSEYGYHETTITQIAAAAGVSRRTFYGYFDSKEECFLATFDQIAAHLREAARRGRRGRGRVARPGRRPLRRRARRSSPPTPSSPASRSRCRRGPGGEVAAHYRRALERALAELTEGMPSAAGAAPSHAVQHSLIGGVVSLIVEKLEAGEGERLEELLPDLVELFLSPVRRPCRGRRASPPGLARLENRLAYIWRRHSARRRADGEADRRAGLQRVSPAAGPPRPLALSGRREPALAPARGGRRGARRVAATCGTTSTRVSKRAGVSPATFYPHYENIGACLLAAYEAARRVASARSSPAPATSPRSAGAAASATRSPDASLPRRRTGAGLPARRRGAGRRAGDRGRPPQGDRAARRAPRRRPRAAPAEAAELPAGTERHLVSGAVAIYAERVAAGDVERLPELGPQLTEMLTAPYVDRAVATGS